MLVLITGLPAAGKTTLGRVLLDELQHRCVGAIHLDGDELRQSSSRDLGFDRASRSEQLRSAGIRGVLAVRRGEVVLLSLIAPYATDRQWLRELIAEDGVYAEFYVATPLDECRRRDPKGLYRAAARGELAQLTGVDAPYEPPVSPDLVLDGRSAPDPQQVDAALKWILAARVGCGARP
jgi:adenylyl-sulfate kinase